MEIKLSPKSIEALAQVISGGSANNREPPIGLYRSGPQLEKFMRECNVEMKIGAASRYPTLIDAIEKANNSSDDAAIRQILIAAVDPRDFINEPGAHENVMNYINKFISYDEIELRIIGSQVQIFSADKTNAAVSLLTDSAKTISFDTVNQDLIRALANVDSDPEDAVTSACSVLESVCRSILVELGEEIPAKKDLTNLYKALREPLGLSPKRDVTINEVEADVRTILGGLNAVVQGIGSLRTHGGDAHGRERGRTRHIDSRIARLAIHGASAVALFLIETWQRNHPDRPLSAISEQK